MAGTDSIVSGAPRDSKTGKLLPDDPRIPTSPLSTPIGVGIKNDDKIDPTPEEISVQISAFHYPVAELVAKPTELPRDHSGWITETASVKGEIVKKWSGNPEEEIMPGEDVLYWMRSQPQPPKSEWSWLIPMQAKILGRLGNGDYVGIRFRSIHGGVFAIQQTRASAVPKLDMITARKKFPPDLCLLPPGE